MIKHIAFKTLNQHFFYNERSVNSIISLNKNYEINSQVKTWNTWLVNITDDNGNRCCLYVRYSDSTYNPNLILGY